MRCVIFFYSVSISNLRLATAIDSEIYLEMSIYIKYILSKVSPTIELPFATPI